jgi:ribosome-associated protein
VSHANPAIVLADLPKRLDDPKGGPLIGTAKRPAKPALTLSSRERACLSARVAADNKARDVKVLDLRAITPLYDFFVIATGGSRRQIHAIAEDVDARLREVGDVRLGIEGYEASKWVVQDYGDLVVHVFDEPTRAYYALEELWADAPTVDWERA